MKCNGHIHNERHQGRKEPCNANLEKVGFNKDKNEELLICRNQRCSEYKRIQTFPVEEEAT